MSAPPPILGARIGCEAKHGYSNPKLAEKVAKRMRRTKSDADVGTYRCDLCRRWHVGSNERWRFRAARG
jgi:hypothetical protein